MQAYGLQVDGKLDAAESLAEKAMSMNGNDRWACTSLSLLSLLLLALAVSRDHREKLTMAVASDVCSLSPHDAPHL